MINKFRAVFFIFLIMVISQPAFSKSNDECLDWKDADFCNAYVVIDDYRKTANPESFPIVIDLVDYAKNDISYYASFWLIKTLIKERKDFFLSADYYNWKRRFLIQLFKYQNISGDDIRAQAYALYLFLHIEPIEFLQTSDLEQMIARKKLPEDLLKYNRCFVINDIPYLHSDQIIEADEFKNCIK